jgi:hypothetical protein
MAEYFVFWRGDNEVIQSKITSDNEKLTPDQWVKLAALSENYEETEADAIVGAGFDLYAVIKGPVVFAY